MDISDYSDDIQLLLCNKFNSGDISLVEVLRNFEMFRDKDFSYLLSKDCNNKYNVNDSEVKDFLSNYENILDFVLNHGNIYSFIHDLNDLPLDERDNYIKEFTDELIDKTFSSRDRYYSPLEFSNEEYEVLFKYSSLTEFFKNRYPCDCERILKQLEDLPENYLFSTQIPFQVLKERKVIYFVSNFGVKNVIDFDNECGHFFTNKL